MDLPNIKIDWECKSIVSKIRPKLIKLWKTRRMIKRLKSFKR